MRCLEKVTAHISITYCFWPVLCRRVTSQHWFSVWNCLTENVKLALLQPAGVGVGGGGRSYQMNFRRWNGGAESLETQLIFLSFIPPSFTLPVLLLIFSPSIGLDTSWPLVFAGRWWGIINRWPSSWFRPGEGSRRTSSSEGCRRSVCAWVKRSDLWRSPVLCGWTRGALRGGALCPFNHHPITETYL